MNEDTKEKQMHSNHRNRMKNIFLENGFDSFTEIQKLEFLLFFAIPQKDVNPIAHRLLDEFGSLQRVLATDFQDLINIKGVGKHTALLLKTFQAVLEENLNSTDETILKHSTETRKYCFNLLKNSTVEEFYVLCMDERCKLLKVKKLNRGSATSVNININEITKLCFTHKATQIVITHNHPSGNAEFSDNDLTMTNSILCNGLLNEIQLVDHILVTPTQTVSLAEKGLIASLEKNIVSHMNVSADFLKRLSSSRTKYIVDKIKK